MSNTTTVGPREFGRRHQANETREEQNVELLPVKRIGATELQHGDVLFFRKPGAVQRYTDLVGDYWRHTAIVANLGGYWWVLEAGLAGYRGRPLSTALAGYDTCVVMRMSHCGQSCGRAIVDEAQRLMTEPTAYPTKAELPLFAMISSSRMTAGRVDGWHGRTARRLAREYVEKTPGFETRTICSRLVYRALQASCPAHRPVIDLTAAKPGFDADRASADGQLAEHFTMPDDIWRSVDQVERFRLKG